MKRFQGSYISGYVQIRIIGPHPERFLHQCTENGIMLWDISKSQATQCEAKMMLQDVKKIRKLRFGTKYKINFMNKHGLPFVKKRYLNKKPLLIGLILSILLLVTLSNMIWQVKVTGVPEELETRIYSKLESYGIHPGALKATIESPNQIQQLLVNDIPELLWVGVELKGTTYSLEGVEKIVIKDEGEKQPGHLIANKNAVIKNMYVKKGQPQVSVNDFVQKGKVLVSGAIEKSKTEDEDEQHDLVAAEGEIRGITWYQANVSIPLNIETEVLTGRVKESYHLKIGKYTLPLWPFRSEGFANEFRESEKNQLQIFGWELPIAFIENRKLEKTFEERQITEKEAIQRGIEQVKKELLLELGKDAHIVSENVLHETIERGKVNLSLYLTVEENIATRQPINQGD